MYFTKYITGARGHGNVEVKLYLVNKMHKQTTKLTNPFQCRTIGRHFVYQWYFLLRINLVCQGVVTLDQCNVVICGQSKMCRLFFLPEISRILVFIRTLIISFQK